jgi:glycosyltransferase involved in cell wall biosynthesis
MGNRAAARLRPKPALTVHGEEADGLLLQPLDCWKYERVARSVAQRRRMRILFVHERFGSLGGAEANALITGRELKLKGHSVALLHGAPTGMGEVNWREVFETCYSLGQFNVRAALEDFSPDIVYVHKMAVLSVIEDLVESGLPLVRMVHDHDIYCMRSYKYFYRSREICTRAASLYCVFGCGAFITRSREGRLPLKYVSYTDKKREIALNQKFDRTITVTEFMKAELVKNGFDAERVEIHPPVPRPGDPNLRSTFSDRNLIVYAGQIIRGKGVDVLLESLALVKAPFECVILGDGHHRAYCEKLAGKLGLADRVHFKGFVPQEELKSYYRECSVVAISSVWPEPIATIGLEVMRYALPVVAFDAGGIRDWLSDGGNGFLVPWMDRRAFAGALEKLLRDKELARKMGERGLEIVSRKYNFAEYIHGLENLFERVISKKREVRSRNNRELVPA